jgi:hypothetical protein
MLNPFFLQGSQSEQGLIQDLVNEQLRMYGVEVYYIPRKIATISKVIREVIRSKFDSAYPIEAYVENYDGYDGSTTILSKFGIQATNELTLIISRERFEYYITPLIEGFADVLISTRPKEGDLIYFPLGDRVFEIKFVEHEKPFYQLQKNYVYELRCELFQYEDEDISTGISEIDDTTSAIGSEGYTEILNLIGVGIASTATATSHIVSGGVRLIQITNRGEGYSSTPIVAISSAPTGGLTASGIATMIGGIIACDGSKDGLKVQGVQITNAGYGYTVAPGVAFIGGGGSGVAATTYIGNGVVGVITVTNGGGGYFTAPTVTFSAPTGIGSTVTAQGVAVISVDGVVTSIKLTNAGVGYTQTPTITISAPNASGVGLGTYLVGETVTGSASSVTARVKSWDLTTNELRVSNLTGKFVAGENIVGSESGASYKLRLLNQNADINPYAQNFEIETEGDAIFDFTESNPFGDP